MAITLVSKLLVLWFQLRRAFGHSQWYGHMLVDIAAWVDYWKMAQGGQIPYVDMAREYPVGAGILYWGMAAFLDTGSWPQMLWVHGLSIIPADLVNAALLYLILKQMAPSRALPLTLLWVLTPTGLVMGSLRFDAYAVTFTLAGFLCHQRGLSMWASLWWSLGCWVKWYPLVFLLAQEWRALVVERRRWQWLSSALIFLGAALALNLPFMALAWWRYGNLDQFLLPYRFHAQRPLYWDTVLGVLTLYRGPLSWERYAPLWTLAGLAVLGMVRPRISVAARGALLCMAAVFFNRVYSTQFHLWFDPFLLIVIAAWRDRRVYLGALGLYVALDLVNVLVYPFGMTWCLNEIGSFAPGSGARGGWGTVVFCEFILIRTALLAVWIGLLLAEPDLAASGPAMSDGTGTVEAGKAEVELDASTLAGSAEPEP